MNNDIDVDNNGQGDRDGNGDGNVDLQTIHFQSSLRFVDEDDY